MKTIETYIIIPTHSNYIDICLIFLDLLEKNWADHPKVIISIMGENVAIKDYNYLYNGKDSTLPQCIYNASKAYHADYYFCFLGDAFINNKIKTSSIIKLVNDMNINHIEYCSLLPVKSSLKSNDFNEMCKYIKYSDRYSHNFVAYIASKSFIISEFCDYKSDYEFETKYLKYANQISKGIFDNRIIVKNNCFKIYHGISKGKWIPSTLRKIKKKNREIDFSSREKLCLKETILLNIGLICNWLLPNNFRRFIKKAIIKIFKVNFSTEF